MKADPTPMNLRDPAVLAATACGVGLLPAAPGTWGSLAALPFAWMLQTWLGPWGLAAAVALVFALGLWSVGRIAGGPAGDDPGAVVIDEVAGQWLTLLFVPPHPMLYLAGFLLFRLADILKPWPVNWADRAVKGALGVMLDDILAALYAGAALFLLAWWVGT
ncbi:MAG: phosphatidylglycerophosphatase A [Rhodospirillales bacterium]|nr:phosphatidylglycerophosphatase A [Rhodospirillales bacterium]